MAFALDSLEERTEALQARAIGTDGLVPVGRLGWLAKGVVTVIVGVLALPIAVGSTGGGGEEASRRGAIEEVADAPFGTVALWLLAAGLILFALWRLVTAALPGDGGLESVVNRIGFVGSAVFNAVLAWTALSFTIGTGDEDGGGQSFLESVSRTLLEHPAGRWLLGLGGLGGLAVAAYFVNQGVTNRFLADIDLQDVGAEKRVVATRVGTIGRFGAALTTSLLSAFVIQAALTADPGEAEGLDGALREVADRWWGTALVLAAGLGLIASGAFDAATARHRRLAGP